MKSASVVHGPKHRRAGVRRFLSSGFRKSLFPDFFGKGGNAFLVDGCGFLGWVWFLVLGLFHIVIVAGQDGVAGVHGWRRGGI